MSVLDHTGRTLTRRVISYTSPFISVPTGVILENNNTYTTRRSFKHRAKAPIIFFFFVKYLHLMFLQYSQCLLLVQLRREETKMILYSFAVFYTVLKVSQRDHNVNNASSIPYKECLSHISERPLFLALAQILLLECRLVDELALLVLTCVDAHNAQTSQVEA